MKLILAQLFLFSLVIFSLACSNLKLAMQSELSPTYKVIEKPWTPNCNTDPTREAPEPLRNPGVRYFEANGAEVYWYSESLAAKKGCAQSKTIFNEMRRFLGGSTTGQGHDFSSLIDPFYENKEATTLFVRPLPVSTDPHFDEIRAFIGHIGVAGEHHPGRLYLFLLGRKADSFTLLVKEIDAASGFIDSLFIGKCLGKGQVAATQYQDLWSRSLGPNSTAKKYQETLNCYLPALLQDSDLKARSANMAREYLPILTRVISLH
jgi:hypothetical protein